ncbi:MAG: fibronectin type III domain-containing protein [Elusimicrobiota bacterium]
MNNISVISNGTTSWAQVDVTAPGQVTGLQSSIVGIPNSAYLSWVTPGDNVYTSTFVAGSGYKIQYSTVSVTSWVSENAQVVVSTSGIAPGQRVYILVTGLVAETTNWFRIWAYDELGNYSVVSDSITFTPSPFSYEILDSDGYTGAYPVVAVDSNGYPHIAYSAGNPLKVKYTKWTGSVWVSTNVDITSENGDDTYVSLALDGNDLPHITFTKNSNLFYANFNGVNWSTSVVTTYANFSSIIVDPAGYPNIAYADSLVSNLKFARWSGTAWSTSTVDSVGTTTRGQYCNLAIDDTGKAYISYLVTNPEYNLMVARYNNSVWTTETVYGAETEINYASSLAMDGERNLHVSLRQETGKDLYYAKYSNSAWVVNPVYTNGDVGKYNAISLDGNANPVIAYSEYVDATDENLMYSRWNGTNWINGCIDAQTRAGTVYPMSVATNNSGTVYIAYFDATSSDLKLAVWSNSGLASPVAGTPRSKAQMPKLVGTSAVYSSSITWSWVDNASNETGYRLYASTTAGASYQLEANESTLVPNTQSYTQVLLSPNNPYSVYVAVVNTGGVAYTAVVTTYTLSLPPTDISAVALSSHSVCVTWSANGNSGTTRWGIERSTDNFVASNTTVKSYNDNFTSTSFTDSGLVNGTQYYYRVKSFNSTGAAAGNNSPVSATPSNGLNTAPNAVTDLTAVPGDTAAQLKLTWTATGENGTAGDLSNAQYKIQYATYTPVWDMNNAQVVITSNIVAGAWQSKVVAGLTENVVYYVTLWIGDEIGNWSGISNVSSSTAKTTLPATPTDMNGTAISGTSILWSWTDNSATENGYIVRTSTSGIVAELGSNTTYWTETGLSPNKAYTRDSYVYNYGGGIAGTPAVMYTLANPPVNTGFSDVQNTSITVTWSINSNPTGTRWGISRSTNGFVDSTVLASYATNLTSTTYNDTGLDTGTRYYYKVLAYNDAAGHLESSYDTAVSVVAEYDVMPPAALTEIVAIPGADVGILDLSWITPGDNGMSGILEPGAQLAVQYSSYTVNWATAAAQVVVSTSSVSPGTQVFHRFSTLTAGATYYVKVWYSDERGNWSDISESATCYAQARDTVLPGTPSGFTASSGILVRLQWLAGGDNSSTGDVVNGKWRIRMSSTVGATYDTAEYSVAVTTSYAAGSTQSVNVTGIAYNVTYYYWLSGQDETDGNWSPWVTATYFLNDTTPPTAPGTPADTGVYTIDNTQVVFVWTGSADTETGLTKYLICVGTFSGGTSVYNNYDVGNNTWTLLSGLTLQSGTVYYAKVCAMNNAGLFSSYSGNSDGIMVDTTTPVINGSVNDGISTDVDIQLSSGTLCINWTAASEPESGIKEYLVAISTAEGENSVNNVLEWSSVGVQLSTAVVSSALEYGRTYYTKIKVVNNAGLSIAVVSDGVVLDNTTVPPAPVAFKGIVLSSDCVKWSWESGTTYISGFYIKSSTGGIVAVLPASTSEYVETGLLDNQQSARYVEAYNVVGSSAVPVVSVFTYVNTPSSVTVVSTAQHVLGLAWPAGRATAFKVGISSDNAVWAIVADKVECTTSVVTGLLPGTTYTVALWYYNADYVLSIDSAVVANVVTIPLEQTVMVPTVAATETKTFTVNGSQLEIRVEVPQGTVDKPVYVAINQNAELAPTNPEVKQKIADAIQKLDVILTDKQIVSNVVELNMYDLAGSKVSGNFAQTVTLSIPYLDVNNDGFVDNTTPLLKEKSLKVYLLNEANSAWELVGGDVDETLNIVHVAVNHFSVYTVIGTKMPENDLAKTRVYPNPYNLGLGVNGITFDYLTAKARIMIFTVTGELVFDQTVETAGKYQWDMANTSGGTVASGVYIYRITNPDNAANVKTGKLAVVK